MNTDYWDRMARNFETEIFSVFANDRKGLITSRIRKLGSPRTAATDLGCGIGGFLPALSQAFGSVTAVDVSAKTLRRARANCSSLGNVRYLKADLTSPKARLPKAGFALSVNTLLTPSPDKSSSMLDLTVGHITPRGHLLLVVPALESALLSRFRLIEWNRRDGMSHAAAIRAAADENEGSSDGLLARGVVAIDGVPTKHFLEGEIVAVLAARRMDVLEIRKIEYPWSSEFHHPPKWMKAPWPWDWLVLARKSS
jgi:SAM-dependent methyltransferase